MLTDKCQAIIDEVITAGGDLTKLSADAVAHIETCLDCRKSLVSIKALKASAVSVIPFAASPALKSKIVSKLDSSMMARKAMSTVGGVSKTVLGVSSVVIGLGLCGVVTCGVISLSNKNEMAYNDSKINTPPATIVSSQSASNSVDLNKVPLKDSEINNISDEDDNSIIDCANLVTKDEDTENTQAQIPSVIDSND